MSRTIIQYYLGGTAIPSCVFVPEFDNTFFCTTSGFMAFPGNSVYASQNLTDWRLASNALSRVAQLPEVQAATNEQFAGMFANTLRYHKGKFYLILAWINPAFGVPRFVLSTATDPFDDRSWSDYFFSGSPIQACYLDTATGNTNQPWPLWNGTGGASAEGLQIFKKDGYYYLLIAEGSTQLGHRASMVRSRSLKGPWEASPNNPLVSNSPTNEYFQNRDPALYNQSILPMGRKTGWPYTDQVRGKMQGPLPKRISLTPSKAFQISPKGHPNTLQILSAGANHTADAQFNASREGLSAMFRRQEHTFFNHTVDLHPNFGKSAGDELGVSNFF
ncbi:glycosyl hydrolase [Bipolaris maydis]|uniref:glycosyl hydrolase n=1 Tax=Cochliobolus heterostrophus TaxID=5016 RepID=UPI0024D9F755|nr:glycosyl hydrolase [Bipolaris maydis]